MRKLCVLETNYEFTTKFNLISNINVDNFILKDLKEYDKLIHLDKLMYSENTRYRANLIKEKIKEALEQNREEILINKLDTLVITGGLSSFNVVSVMLLDVLAEYWDRILLLRGPVDLINSEKNRWEELKHWYKDEYRIVFLDDLDEPVEVSGLKIAGASLLQVDSGSIYKHISTEMINLLNEKDKDYHNKMIGKCDLFLTQENIFKNDCRKITILDRVKAFVYNMTHTNDQIKFIPDYNKLGIKIDKDKFYLSANRLMRMPVFIDKTDGEILLNENEDENKNIDKTKYLFEKLYTLWSSKNNFILLESEIYLHKIKRCETDIISDI